MSHLILHAGPPKTGSTAIQRGLFRQSEQLRDTGIHYYWGTGPWHWALILPFRAAKQNETLPLALRKKFASVDDALRWSREEWEALEEWQQFEKPETVIISSEHLAFGGDKAALIGRLSRLFDRIDVIGYARDPVDAFVSATEENIRTGWGFADLPSPVSPPPNSIRKLQPYEALVGHDHLHINRFSRSTLSGGDVVTDFFHQLSHVTGKSISPPRDLPDANPGVCGAAVAWFLMVNQEQMISSRPAGHFKPFFQHRLALVEIFRASERMAALPRLKMTDPVLEAALRQRSRPMLEWVNAHYLRAEHRFPLGEPLERLPTVNEARSRLADWLRSYLTPEALEIIFAELSISGGKLRTIPPASTSNGAG